MLRILPLLVAIVLPVAAQVALQVAPRVDAGQQVQVGFSGTTNERDFISIVPKATPEGKYAAYQYARAGNQVTLQAPDVAGDYEVRYLEGQAPYKTLARVPLTVAAVTATLTAPGNAAAGADFTVAWQGPNNRQDFITLVKKGTPEKKYGHYVYTAGGNPVTLRAPDEPGEYEIRYLTGGQYLTLGSAPITVGAVSASVTPPSSVTAGAEFTFQWTGPNNTGDFITIVPEGTPDKKYEQYVSTAKGNPAKLTAPDAPGEYELRYLTAQTYATLAKASIVVGGVNASVKGPASVEGGQPFEVSWTGPGNARDWISIAAQGGAKNDYSHYAYVTKGNPVTLNAPLVAGEYEVRYQTGQTYSILARQPLRVGPPKSQPGKLRVVSGAAGQAGIANTTAVEIILDASGSMLQRVAGKRRIDIAKQVLTDLVQNTIPPQTPLALRVFGHKQAGSCGTDLEQPLAPLVPEKTAALIAGITAMNEAKTPIGRSLELVAQDLQSNRSERVVVLVTDGEETCDGDPAAAIEKLRAAGVEVRVNIVGFAISDQALKDTFRHWAHLGGGEYFDAGSAAELGASLVEAVRVPFEALNAQGQVIAEGLVDGDPADLPSGSYTVRSKGGRPRTVANVTVQPGETAVATLPR